MFKKITAILAATISLVLAGSSLSPAFAAGTASNPGSLVIEKNTVDVTLASATTTQRTFTINVPANTKKAVIGFNYRISQDAQTRIINAGGQTFETKITGVGPNGQALVENTNSQNGLYLSQAGNWSQGYNYTYVRTLNLTSGINTGEARGNVTFQIGSEYASNQVMPSGNYTFTTSISADGVEVTPALYNSSQDSIGIISAGASYILGGAIESVFPAGATIRPYSKVCVDAARVNTGDSITVTHIVNGVAQTSGTTSEWTRRSSPTSYLGTYSTNPQQGPSPATTETRVLEAADVTSGIRIVPAYWNTFTSDGTNVFTYDMSVYNDTTATEVSKDCAPPAPAAPTLTLDGRTSWNAVIATPSAPMNSRIYGYLYKASDLNTVLAECSSWVMEASTTCWGYLSNPGVDLGTDYVVKARLNTNEDGYSAYSAASATAQVTGPPAPSAPTLAITSPTSATVKIPTVSGITNSQSYRATLYVTTDRSQYVARSATYNCNQDMQDPTVMSCSISAEGLVAPNQYVATGEVKNNSDIWSAESADSNIVSGISTGFALSTPVSGLSTQGKARLVGDNALGTILNSTSRKVSTSPDGTGGIYLANRTATNEIKIGRITGATSALDSSFGSAGYVAVTIDGSAVSANTAGKVSWFGDTSNRKWISTISTETGQLFAEGSATTSTATATTIAVRTFCRDTMNNQQANGELRVYSAPTVRPLAMVNCNVWSMGTSDQRMILAKINADGSLTQLVNMTPQGANDYYATWGNDDGMYELPELSNSVNLSATGSDVAIAIAIVNATYTEGNYNVSPPVSSTMVAHSRALWRVTANMGTPTSTALNYTTNTNLMSMNGPTTEPTLRLQPFNNGNKIFAMVLKNATGCTYSQTPPFVENCNAPGASPRSLKLHEVNVASGTLNLDAAAKTLSGLSSTLTEFQAALPTSGNVLQYVSKSANSNCGMDGCTVTGGTFSVGAIDATTGTTVRGESLTYTVGGSPVNALWTNATGKLQWLFTKQNATGHSIIEWQPTEISSTPVSVPNVTGGATGLSLNAGGSKIEITGTNLTLVSKVLFGTVEAKFTKSATKLTVTVPSSSTTGSVNVTLTYTGGQAAMPAGTWVYMGAAKRTQTLTPTGLGDPTHSGAPEANRNFSVASSVQGYTVTVVSKTPTVCTYVSGVIDFIGNGTCTLQASQVGDAVTNAANTTYEIYYESVVNASALYSTDAGKPTITLTGQGLGAVSKVMFGNIEVVPTKKTDTTITVKVPAAPTAGANVDVSLKYTNGTVVDTDLNFDFVGTTKLSQVVTLLAGFSQATYGDSARTLSASSATADLAATDLPGLPYVYTTSTSSVCAIALDQLRFLGAGDCKVKATQAGNAGVNASVSTEFTIVVAAKAQTITVDETPISITDVTGANLGATNSNGEVPLEYTSSNELICTVDGEGSVTGLSAGTCTIKINAPADSRYLAATEKSVTVTVTLSEVDAPADATDDIDATPVPIANGGANTFLELSDPSLQVSWDKANGKLTPRATGVYTGYVVAELKFTVAGVNYVCTNVFGTTSKLSNPVKPTAPVALGEGATAKQIAAFAKAQAAYVKALAAYKVAYAKTWGTKVFASKNFCADTNKIKNATAQNPFGTSFVTAVKAAKTTAEKKSEANALKALKNFTGSVTISVKRWRAWPTTMKNKTGNAGTGKTISATKKVNTLTLG